MNTKILVKQYAINNNISVQAVYQKIKNGALKSFKKGGKTYIILNNDIKEDGNNDGKSDNILLQNLKQENEILKVKIEEKDKLLQSKDEVIQAKTNENKSLLIATQTMKQLQEKQDFKQIDGKDNRVTGKINRSYIYFFILVLLLPFIFWLFGNGFITLDMKKN